MRAGALVLSASCLGGCDKATPEVWRSADIPSPDGRWVVTSETVNNGLGMGASADYFEVHLRRAGQPLGEHGDPSKTVLFYIGEDGGQPRVRWVDATHLLVEHEAPAKLSARPPRYADVTITYKTMPQRPTD